MKTRTAVLLAVSTAAAAENGETRWAGLPANPAAAVAPALVVAPPPDETWVRLVGTGGPGPTVPPAPAPVKVIAVTLAAPGAAAGRDLTPAIPTAALWPDAGGRIVEPMPGFAAERGAAVRNPWLPGAAASAARRSQNFLFGGYIAGGAGGPVALVNGRAVRKGDTIGEFSVGLVLSEAVLLERSGVQFVLPRGAHITVELQSS